MSSCVKAGAPIMLDYENQLFLDAIHENELFILGKGILTDEVMKNILKAYTTETSLVFVLGASRGEENYFKDKLQNERIYSITSEEYLANDRKLLYANGGVFFITSRILVMDFLKEIFPIDKVTGIVILRAHNVVENSQEAFILRLYRTKNKTGFIKAFSESPTSFLLGFSRLNRVMRSCFLANVSLWPRFHDVVKQSLIIKEDLELSNVVEIQLNLTEEMREIQSNFLDLVSWAVSELKRLVPALNYEEINAETALTGGFQKIVGAHLDVEWNTVNNKAKELLNDIKVFRLLLTYLTKFDCVSFYSVLCNYTSSEMAFTSSWVITASAEKIILAARRRILKPSKKAEQQNEGKKGTFRPEVHPKWLAVGEILNDIFSKSERKQQLCPDLDDDESDGDLQVLAGPPDLKTLIFAGDSKTCNILRDYLTDGSEEVLAKLVASSDNIKIDLPSELVNKLKAADAKRREQSEPVNKRPKLAKDNGNEDGNNGNSLAKEEKVKEDIQITLTQIKRKYENRVEFFPCPVVIRPYRSVNEEEAFGVIETLARIKPDVIVIFDPDLELVRQVEIHRARMAGKQNIRVYFLAFRNSVEEQVYLTSIQREKLGFEKLIEEKATMVVPEEREARDELNQDLWRDPTKASDIFAAEKGQRNMEKQGEERDVILVDIREFRSELPSLLHKRGIDLEPLTLDVGDYILTPEICVERKSISDLIGSLNSGRLYKQAEAMGRHYKKPILLIEHEQKTQVSATYRRRDDLTQIMPKLQVLTMNFPGLRLVWSPSPHYTSEVFQELKKGKAQPSAEEAMAIQKESVGTHISTKYNPITHSFLSKMPGMDSRNIYTILNRCSTLAEVAALSEKELAEILENSQTAALLYAGLHSENLTAAVEGQSGNNRLKSVKAAVSKPKKPFFRGRGK